MSSIISINKAGYEPLIDLIKAYSIVLVVIAHLVPVSVSRNVIFELVAGMQVPMFLLVQVFHAYKHGSQPTINYKRLFKRILLPFFVIQLIIIAFEFCFSSSTANEIIVSFIKEGGYGQGSYFVWVYIQIAFLLALIWPLTQKLTRNQLLLLFIIISVCGEILFSLIKLPDYIYRLLAFRYLFIIPLALIWVDEGVVLDGKNIVLSILSIASVFLLGISSNVFEPFIYNTTWTTHRWMCYYYLPIFLTYFLWVILKLIGRTKRLLHTVQIIAKSSYDIFLIQMLVFWFIPEQRMSFINSLVLRSSIWMILTFLLSIIGGLLLNQIRQGYLFKVE